MDGARIKHIVVLRARWFNDCRAFYVAGLPHCLAVAQALHDAERCGWCVDWKF